MSYILDALKKIEREKSKKAGPDGRINITGDLFHERKKPSGRNSIWKTAAIVVVAVLVTCAGTWFVLRGDGQKSRPVVRSAVSVPPVAVTPPVIPAPVPIQAVQAPPAQVISVPPASSPSTGGKQPEAAAASPRSNSSRLKKALREPIPSPVQKQAAPTVPPPADIKLSGIAWQDERAGRRAVINGFLLKEGAVVSGARITDIQADRVRFSSAAGVFEIRLDAVLPSEVKK